MVVSEQLAVDRDIASRRAQEAGAVAREPALHAARDALRAQIARLEHELSKVIAGGFPNIPAQALQASPGRGAALLTMEELECSRDRLVLGLRQAQARAAQRVALELRSEELLEDMKLEPGRYKFKRLPLADLGQGKCGAWVVKPRLGLVGMLAGWWELKLSSGCPLARGRAPARPVQR
jgi:hypothetical protein